MIDSFVQLVCGTTSSAGTFSNVMLHLEQSLRSLLNELRLLPPESENRISLFGPLIGRSILELTATSVIGRLDPFRLLFLREVQMRGSSNSNYLGERSQISIQWSGDIRSRENVPTAAWEGEKPIGSITRALFAETYDEIYWRNAFTIIVDALQASHTGPWFDELRLIDLNSFLARTRSDCDRAYSTLSKGIHHEFVIPMAALYNHVSVLGYLRDAIRLSARIALVANAIPTCHGRIEVAQALNLFSTCQQFELSICPSPTT